MQVSLRNRADALQGETIVTDLRTGTQRIDLAELLLDRFKFSLMRTFFGRKSHQLAPKSNKSLMNWHELDRQDGQRLLERT